MTEALEKAVALAGGQAEFARRLTAARDRLNPKEAEEDVRPIKQQHVDYWLRVMKKLPGDLGRAAELVVDGEVTRYEFRPDVFGEQPEPPLRRDLVDAMAHG